MRLVSAVIFLSLSYLAFGSDPKTVPAGSKVFVEASDGFDIYLAAALQKKKVPVVVVSEKEKADYELQGVSDHQKASGLSLRHRYHAGIRFLTSEYFH
jgi:hypothetical protein